MIFSKYLFDILSLSLLRLPFQELSLAEERCYVVDGGRQSGQFTLQWLKLVHLSISLSLSPPLVHPSRSRIRPDTTDSFFLYRLFASSLVLLSPSALASVLVAPLSANANISAIPARYALFSPLYSSLAFLVHSFPRVL